mmetsp:Transcript_36790/g.77644  ORF Transcript_36790/g.77644 Transcript_36790/m.77644 type:complete len:393 (-) Transcript_36790:359-1537(-)
MAFVKIPRFLNPHHGLHQLLQLGMRMLHPIQVPSATLQQTTRHVDVVPAKILQTPSQPAQHHDGRGDAKLCQLSQVPHGAQPALDVLILLEPCLSVHLLLQFHHEGRVRVDPVQDGGEAAPVGEQVEARAGHQEEGLVETLARFGIGTVIGAESIGELVDGLAAGCLREFLFEQDHEFVVGSVLVFHGVVLILIVAALLAAVLSLLRRRILSCGIALRLPCGLCCRCRRRRLVPRFNHHIHIRRKLPADIHLTLDIRPRPVLPRIPLPLPFQLGGVQPQQRRGFRAQQVGHVAVERPGLLVVERSQSFVLPVAIFRGFGPQFDATAVGGLGIAGRFLLLQYGNVDVQRLRERFHGFFERFHEASRVLQSLLAGVRQVSLQQAVLLAALFEFE